MDGIALLVGLGNPGQRYAATRHNAGFWFLDAVLAQTGAALRNEDRFHAALARVDLAGRRVWVMAPTTFMNLSGDAVAAVAHYYRIDPRATLVVHDDLDLPPGTVRLKRGGGYGGHNGLIDIGRKLGAADFVRLRLGIGRPPQAREAVSYVLEAPDAEERALIDSAIEKAMALLPEIVAGEYERVMNVLHQPLSSAQADDAAAGGR